MKNNTAALIAGAVVASASLFAACMVAIFAPGDPATLITLVLGSGATLTITVVTLGRLEQTKSTVEDLANGKMDAKIRAGVADVLANHLIDPAAEAQLVEDQAKRDA